MLFVATENTWEQRVNETVIRERVEGCEESTRAAEIDYVNTHRRVSGIVRAVAGWAGVVAGAGVAALIAAVL